MLIRDRCIGITGYARIDAFIRTDSGETSIIEINTLPGLTNESDVPAALKAVGVSLQEFFAHLVNLALSR